MLETIITAVISVITALGGVELIKYRNTKKSAAKAAEWNVADSVYERHSKIMEEHDKKFQELRGQINTLQERVLEMTAEKDKLKFEIEVKSLQTCEVRGCKERKPPGAY